MGVLCSHVLKVLDFIRIHIVKRETRDARDILPPHLTHYQKDHAHKILPLAKRKEMGRPATSRRNCLTKG